MVVAPILFRYFPGPLEKWKAHLCQPASATNSTHDFGVLLPSCPPNFCSNSWKRGAVVPPHSDSSAPQSLNDAGAGWQAYLLQFADGYPTRNSDASALRDKCLIPRYNRPLYAGLKRCRCRSSLHFVYLWEKRLKTISRKINYYCVVYAISNQSLILFAGNSVA